ncbi:MAG TPA: sigma 54-interacting transcriptional regulator [Bdellovibrionota bacterium]|nr:sigma 54-interacting transcriptional regulator [Bdellovibrionota bacterium]
MIRSETKVIRSGEQPTMLLLPKSKLIVIGPDGGSHDYVIDKGTISIGTSDGSDLRLNDETVSRNHAEIIKTKDGYLLRDLGSTNGTFVGGLKVKEAYLSASSVIKIGKTRIKFTPLDEQVEIYPSKKTQYGDMIGKSLEMRKIFGILEKVAPTNVTVVVEGETGTGKELIAKAIHQNSRRSRHPFIVFDCGAVAENLIESELFGHERGSFTGATTTRQGAFELADGGTIFLDEIGELSMELQPKLLRALETGEVKRVGADRPKKVDVRVVVATNRHLKDEVKKARFREDLYFRISVVQIQLPPLRKRPEDVPLLIKAFFEGAKHDSNKPDVHGFSEEAQRLLREYQWPGNVRELKNAIDRAISFCDGSEIDVQHLPDYIQERSIVTQAHPAMDGGLPFKDAKEKWIEAFERDYLVECLRKNNMNISKAAKQAGIDRKSVQRLLKKYSLNVKDL